MGVDDVTPWGKVQQWTARGAKSSESGERWPIIKQNCLSANRRSCGDRYNKSRGSRTRDNLSNKWVWKRSTGSRCRNEVRKILCCHHCRAVVIPGIYREACGDVVWKGLTNEIKDTTGASINIILITRCIGCPSNMVRVPVKDGPATLAYWSNSSCYGT